MGHYLFIVWGIDVFVLCEVLSMCSGIRLMSGLMKIPCPKQ